MKTNSDFDWLHVPEGQFKTGRTLCSVQAFDISFTPLLLGQFRDFAEQLTGDFRASAEYRIHYSEINYGPADDDVIYGLSHRFAVAYSEWADLRLPTNAELGHFFDFAVRSGMTFVYAGECWTSEFVGNDEFVTRDGPYLPDQLTSDESEFVRMLRDDQTEYDPCVRVVRSG